MKPVWWHFIWRPWHLSSGWNNPPQHDCSHWAMAKCEWCTCENDIVNAQWSWAEKYSWNIEQTRERLNLLSGYHRQRLPGIMWRLFTSNDVLLTSGRIYQCGRISSRQNRCKVNFSKEELKPGDSLRVNLATVNLFGPLPLTGNMKYNSMFRKAI